MCTHVCIYVMYVCMFVICIRVHIHNLQSIWLVEELLSRVEVGSAHMRVYVYACDMCVYIYVVYVYDVYMCCLYMYVRVIYMCVHVDCAKHTCV